MRNRSILVAVVLALLGAAAWQLLSAASSGAAVAPDAASQRAVTALVSGLPAAAAAAIPASFASTEGYRPVVRGSVLLDPHGACSSPVPLPQEFTPVCRRHDLGYDLLRHADAEHGTLPAQARQAIDTQFARGLATACRTRTGVTGRQTCAFWAGVAALAVRTNSMRQRWSTPGRETGLTVTAAAGAATAVLAGLWLVGVGLVAAVRRLRRFAPRVSTSVTLALATFAALFPSFVPKSAVVQGVAVTAFCAMALAVVRRIRPAVARAGPATRVRVLAAVAPAFGLLAWWATAQQDARRRLLGLPDTDTPYWLLTAATVAVVIAASHGVRWVWRHRRRTWRAALAGAVAVGTLAMQSPVHAVAVGPSPDRPLLAASPVGGVRVYAEQRAGESLKARAARAVDELVRRGGLAKSRVVIAVPTGSGWVDPSAVTGLEERFHGDVAIIAEQYAARPSWVAYLVDRSAAEDSARDLFAAVAARINDLPADRRPSLHVYGESLGAVGGQAIFDDPGARQQVCSVLWVGSPGGATVGMPREGVVANADDPVVHATPDLLIRPTVAGLPWLPVVSYAQAGFDLVGALSVPAGSGHRYGPDQAEHLAACPRPQEAGGSTPVTSAGAAGAVAAVRSSKDTVDMS